MVARCAPADRSFDIVHAYFRTQSTWLAARDLKAAILAVAKPFGFTPQSFDACIANQALFAGLEHVKKRGSPSGCEATPTFFINGKKYEGALSLDELDKAIATASVALLPALVRLRGARAMKVNRLRLHGFKSFVDPTEIPIEPGVTGVVGPNGCGKSNLARSAALGDGRQLRTRPCAAGGHGRRDLRRLRQPALRATTPR